MLSTANNKQKQKRGQREGGKGSSSEQPGRGFRQTIARSRWYIESKGFRLLCVYLLLTHIIDRDLYRYQASGQGLSITPAATRAPLSIPPHLMSNRSSGSSASFSGKELLGCGVFPEVNLSLGKGGSGRFLFVGEGLLYCKITDCRSKSQLDARVGADNALLCRESNMKNTV
ncbi:hypothetical protein BX600DRAFT_455669 [Xylariales sp. PMI_506]|nr:hypothetical protein BX600DRAFT_455669 [Xylariales sp. PMI_506]